VFAITQIFLRPYCRVEAVEGVGADKLLYKLAGNIPMTVAEML
jgi:hypothetical protein